MRTAVDSNIVFDLLSGEPAAAAAAERALSAAASAGPAIICPVVYAELAAAFDDQAALLDFLGNADLLLDAFSPDALRNAAQAWRTYTRRRGSEIECRRCGRRSVLSCSSCQGPIVWRQHMIADFLVGGHAAVQADRLLTCDRGYYRTYFPNLSLTHPV